MASTDKNIENLHHITGLGWSDVEKFEREGYETCDEIYSLPESELTEIEGIGPKKAQLIRVHLDSWADNSDWSPEGNDE